MKAMKKTDGEGWKETVIGTDAAKLAVMKAVAEEKDIRVAVDRPSHIYRLDEDAPFTLTGSGRVKAQFSMDGAKVLDEKIVTLKTGVPQTIKFRPTEPCFVRCKVFSDAKTPKFLSEVAAAFEPENIRPVLDEPSDFDTFWAGVLANLKTIPPDFQVQHLEKLSTNDFAIYSVSAANFDNTRIYGFYAAPKKMKIFPLLVGVPGGGPGSIASRFAASADFWYKKAGTAYFEFRVHKYAPAETVEEDMANHEIYKKSVGDSFYYAERCDDIKKSFLHRAISGGLRLVNWALSQPGVDKKHVVCFGASQGGDFGIFLSGLQAGFTAAWCGVPGVGDIGACMTGRRPCSVGIKEYITYNDQFRYYDGVNFAKRIRIPVLMTINFLDNACPPSGAYPMFQSLRGKKILLTEPTSGHSGSDEYVPFIENWAIWQLHK